MGWGGWAACCGCDCQVDITVQPQRAGRLVTLHRRPHLEQRQDVRQAPRRDNRDPGVVVSPAHGHEDLSTSKGHGLRATDPDPEPARGWEEGCGFVS